jgi:transcriptional regulator with XRE-family HTH domain
MLSSGASKPITQQRLSELLGVSWSTVARWESGGRPDPPLGRKLARIRQVIKALGDMVKPEYRIRFLEQENADLLKLRPVDLLDNDRGMERVLNLIEATATGAFG